MQQHLYALIMGLALVLLAACGGASAGMAGDSAPRSEAPAAPAEMAEPSGFEGVAKEENSYIVDGRNLAGMPAPAPPPIATASQPQPQPPQGASGSGAADKPAVSSQVAAVRGPVLIYTAQFTMGVFEVTASLTQIEDLARELGGF